MEKYLVGYKFTVSGIRVPTKITVYAYNVQKLSLKKTEIKYQRIIMRIPGVSY